MFQNGSLLITGGTGSFGNAVLRRFLKSDLREIRIFSRDEKKQETMRLKIANKKLKFYIKNPEKLKLISINANNYVNQFKNFNDEKIISLLVLEKFFNSTNQKKSLINFWS